jgi:hypothetical protein
MTMNSIELFKQKALLKGFHPDQALYIGILAGIKSKSYRKPNISLI